LQGSLTVEVEFLATQSDARKLIERVSKENVRAVYTLIPATFGVIGADA
jgi:hypothetical protein